MMFANLRKKIRQEGGTIYEISETLAAPGIASPAPSNHGDSLARTASIDSLDSVGDQMRGGRRREDHVKKLEGKVTELAGIVREKNLRIAELEKASRQAKEEQERASGKLKESFMAEIQQLWTDHKKKLEESLKTQAQLESQLKAAEENIGTYKEKYFKMEEETDEMQDFTMQELSKIKHMLINKEKEVQTTRDELEETRSKLETARQETEVAKKELLVNLASLTKLQDERQRDIEEKRNLQATIKSLQNDKMELEKTVDEMTTTLQKTRSMLSNVERSSFSAQDRLQTCQRELELVKGKLSKLKEEKDERESDYKDRIQVLESRVSEGDLDVDERIQVLQTERSSLETKLSEAKSHMSEARIAWGERTRLLESQIANLNEKIAEDSSEMAQQLSEKDSMRSNFERQISELQSRLREGEEKVVELEEVVETKEFALTRHSTEMELLKSKLQSTQENLQQRVSHLSEQLSAERQENKTEKTDLHADLDRANRERKEAKDHLNRVEKELHSVKEQLNNKNEEVDDLSKDRFSKDLKLTEMKADLSRMEVEYEDARKKWDAAKSEIKSQQNELRSHLDNKKQLVSTLDSLRAELESTKVNCERRVMKLQMEYDAKARDCELANLSTRELKEKIEDIELERETVLVNLEREEVARLKTEMQAMEAQLLDKNKTIKLQQQRLSDLKKALQRELRVQTLPNEDSGSTFNLSSPPSSSGTNHRRTSSTQDLSFNGLPAPSLPAPSPVPYTGVGPHPLSTLSEVNFTYLKHVLLKFLLSRESEAVHLVRAISTLLKFTSEEEKLLKETMEYKMSWFGARPRLTSQGQRSKHIPPKI